MNTAMIPDDGTLRSTPAKPVAFIFQNKALTLEGSAFVLSPCSDRPVLKVDIGDVRGTIPLAAVKQTFGIASDSEDARLLQLVEKSLRFVRLIRHGDKIPSEILDGTASWSVEDRHRDLAWLKVATTILGHLGVQGAIVSGTVEAKTNLRQAADTLAGRLGLPVERRQEVLDRLEVVANDLAYIEALRDFYKPLFDIPRKLREIGKGASRDPEFAFDVKRATDLIATPIGQIRSALDSLDDLLADPVAALKAYEKTLKAIRGRRDALHVQSFDWRNLLPLWRDLDTQGDEVGSAVGRLCRFLIPRYLQTKVWA